MSDVPNLYWRAHQRMLNRGSSIPSRLFACSHGLRRAMLAEMWDGFLILSGEQLAYVNDQLCNMLGYTRTELMGMPGGMLPEEWPGWRVLLDALRADSDHEVSSGDLEFEITRKDGTQRWFLARYATHSHGDDCRMAFVIVTDVTERRRVMMEQEQLIHELSTFAQTVAHGLKSPLTLIRVSAEVLATEGPVGAESEFYPYLDTVLRGERVMRNMIQELLLLAGVSQQQIEVRPLAMEGIVKSALERMSMMARDYGAVISVAQQWPAAWGYGPWVEEIWVNYISNAIKYGGTPPHLKLGATEESVGWVHFWVRDNGCGLSEEEQKLLFRPFKRLTSRSVSGEGLGLSIVAQIMDKLGGQVTVRSLPEGGSEFGFVLPAMQRGH